MLTRPRIPFGKRQDLVNPVLALEAELIKQRQQALQRGDGINAARIDRALARLIP